MSVGSAGTMRRRFEASAITTGADRVTDKTSANYCTCFRPARGAWRGNTDAGRERVQDDLAELFGLEPESPQSAVESSHKAVANARRELDALFGMESDPEAESGAADSKVRGR